MQRSHRLKSWGPLKGPVAEAAARRGRRHSRLGGGHERRNPAVGRIDDEPRPAAAGHLIDVAELGGVADLSAGVTAEKRRAVERFLLTLGRQLGQLFFRQVGRPASLETCGTLERRAVFVLVRVVPLEIGITPGRPRLSGPALRLGEELPSHCQSRRSEDAQRSHRGIVPRENVAPSMDSSVKFSRGRVWHRVRAARRWPPRRTGGAPGPVER